MLKQSAHAKALAGIERVARSGTHILAPAIMGASPRPTPIDDRVELAEGPRSKCGPAGGAHYVAPCHQNGGMRFLVDDDAY